MVFVFAVALAIHYKTIKSKVMETKKSQKADLERKRPLFFSLGLVLTLGFVLLAFSWKTPASKVTDLKSVQWEEPEEVFIPPTKDERKVIAPPPLLVATFTLVGDDTDFDEPNLDIFDSDPTNEGINAPVLNELKKSDFDEEEVVQFPEEWPEFPGGMSALLSFIGKTIKYPMVAAENGIQGRVFVNFVINANGQVSDARILRGVDPSLDQEALRVVMAMPRWKPGKQSGRAVRVSYNVPINFVLQ